MAASSSSVRPPPPRDSEDDLSSPSRVGREGRPLIDVRPEPDYDDAIATGDDQDHRRLMVLTELGLGLKDGRAVLTARDDDGPSREEGWGRGGSSSPDDDLIQSALDGCNAAAASLDRDSLDRNLRNLRSILTRLRPGLRPRSEDAVGGADWGGTDRGGGHGAIAIIREDGEGNGGDDDDRRTAAVSESTDAIEVHGPAQVPKNPDDIGSTATSANAFVAVSSSKPPCIAKATATMTCDKEREDAEDGENSHKRAKGTSGKKMPMKKVPYKDYSHVQPNASTSLAQTPESNNKQHKFTEKLHAVLANPAYADVICWLPHGRSWKIRSPLVFEEKLLSPLFGHCHLNSFMRQVHGWGFRRVKSGRDRNAYYHEMFLRGMPHLLDQMRRESVRDKKRRCARDGESAHESTPDFYKISRKHPVPENPKIPPEAPTTLKVGHIDHGISAAPKGLVPPGVAALQAAESATKGRLFDHGISAASKGLIPPGVAALQAAESATPHTFVRPDGAREVEQSGLGRDHSVVDRMLVMPSRSQNNQSMGLLGISRPAERSWPQSEEERLAKVENCLNGLLAREQQNLSSLPVAASLPVGQDLGLSTGAPRSLSNLPIAASSAVDATLGLRTEAPRWLDPRLDLQRPRLGGANPAESPNTGVFLSEAEYCRLKAKADGWPRL